MDRNGVVHSSEYALRKRANLTDEQVADGLRVLESPDVRRPGQEHEGRRVVRIDGVGGPRWQVLNHQKYQHAFVAINSAARQARYRERLRVRAAGGNAAYGAPGETRAEREAKRKLKPLQDEIDRMNENRDAREGLE